MDMEELMKTSRAISGVLFLFLLISAFYLYGLKGALLIILVLWTLTSLLALVGVIPIVGQVVYWYAAKELLYPAFFSWFPDIEASWLSETIFWLGMIYCIGLTMATFAFRSMNE